MIDSYDSSENKINDGNFNVLGFFLLDTFLQIKFEQCLESKF